MLLGILRLLSNVNAWVFTKATEVDQAVTLRDLNEPKVGAEVLDRMQVWMLIVGV